MEPKKYRAKTIQSAINLIKEELGPDAMILSTRRLPKSIRDPYGEDVFEVTAASPARMRKEAPPTVRPSMASTLKNPEKPVREIRPRLDTEELGENISLLTAELNKIKKMMDLFYPGEHLSGVLQNHPEYLNLYGTLIKSGLSDMRSRWLIEKIDFEKREAHQKLSPEKAVHLLLRELHSLIKVATPFETIGGNKCVAAFIGPTGVGKTTTIAKVAADLHLKKKKNIGLISIDDYRIGALEQLKTFASIMGVPCIPAFSKKDFQTALKKLSNREMVLIDTAGHSHLDENRMQELKNMIAGHPFVSTHLVLSATTDRFDMKDAAQGFSVLNPQSLIFTKLDETRRRGVIVDQTIDMGLPVSFLTNGQKVPDDILTATSKKILQMVFGLDGSSRVEEPSPPAPSPVFENKKTARVEKEPVIWFPGI